MSSAGAFSTVTATLSLLALPVVAIASKFAEVRQLLEANTALLAAAAAAAIACEMLGGPEAFWAGAAELSSSGTAGDAAAASGALWWAPRVTLLLLALGGTAGPVLLLALVPTLRGCSLGHAYGELETLSVLGQARVRARASLHLHTHACACTYMRMQASTCITTRVHGSRRDSRYSSVRRALRTASQARCGRCKSRCSAAASPRAPTPAPAPTLLRMCGCYRQAHPSRRLATWRESGAAG